MQSSSRARRLGRQLRRELDPDLSLSPWELFDALRAYLGARGIEVFSSPARRLKGRCACIKRGKLDYDKALEDDPVRLVHVIAHETGHALQHGRVHGLFDFLDPAQVMTAAVSQRGLAEARYSPVLRDEFQAEAFAIEFVCPSDEALAIWLGDSGATSQSIATRFHTTTSVARAQLGEALHDRVHGTAAESAAENATNECAPVDPDRTPDGRQRDAIVHIGSATLVDAGPGCGKTFTLVERVAWGLSDAVEKARKDAREGEIGPDEESRIRRETAARTLVLTFSTEAAGELEERITARLSPEEAQEVHVATFHGFGRQILAEHGALLGVDAKAPVLDEAAQAELFLAALATPGAEPIVNLKDPEETAREAARHAQHMKQSLTMEAGITVPWSSALFTARVDALEKGSEAPQDAPVEWKAFATAFSAYESAKSGLGAVDFADLVALPIYVLRDRPEVARHYRARYAHVLVDEFQDVSRAVSLFLALLCGPEGEPWVVGDPNQSIYRFLNADPENVARFPEVFTGTAVFELESNYRSAPEIVAVANELAHLLRSRDDSSAVPRERFVAVGSEVAGPALPEEPDPVVVAVSESDDAEREGVAATVAAWIDSGVPPHEIAVLARRNIDVREIALALGDRGIRTAAGTVMTPDGAAGDLAAAVTFADGRAGFRSALPRLAHGLGRGHRPADRVDRAIAWVLDRVPAKSEDLDEAIEVLEAPAEIAEIVGEVVRAYRVLRAERFVGDAFSMLAAFLFEGSEYARRLLQENNRDALVEASVVLRRAEASTTLAQAAAYRHAHALPGGAERARAARASRLDFAAAFRRSLASGIPSAVTPPRVEGAVQVMTCHASKGLEFPYVCVVGQTLSPLTSGFDWFPDDLQPDPKQDSEQADALFFVGATRAQRALVVSYAERPTVGRGNPRDVTDLLQRWMTTGNVRQVRWSEHDDAEVADPVDHDAVWGKGRTPRLSPYHLDAKTCEVCTYLEEVAGLRFPEATPPLYPLYVDRLRQAVRIVLRTAHDGGQAVDEDSARATFARVWASTAKLYEDHPLVELYGRLGLRSAAAFARAYAAPLATAHRPIDLDALESGLHTDVKVSLGILDAFHADDGRPVAIILRTESYATKAAKRGGSLVWSDLGSPRRQIALAVFHEHWAGESLDPRVQLYSAVDGALYEVAWSSRKTNGQTSMERLNGRASEKLVRLTNGPYSPRPSTWDCPRCRSRVLCPHHLLESSRSG